MSSKIFDDFQEMFHDVSEFIDSIRDLSEVKLCAGEGRTFRS